MAMGVKHREKEGDKPLPTRYFSSKQEKAVAKAIDGQVVPNSGATPWSKGDVSGDKILIECKTKTTDSKSITIQEDWLKKNQEEAAFMGKEFTALAFSFGPDKPNYYIIDESLFTTLLNILKDS